MIQESDLDATSLLRFKSLNHPDTCRFALKNDDGVQNIPMVGTMVDQRLSLHQIRKLLTINDHSESTVDLIWPNRPF